MSILKWIFVDWIYCTHVSRYPDLTYVSCNSSAIPVKFIHLACKHLESLDMWKKAIASYMYNLDIDWTPIASNMGYFKLIHSDKAILNVCKNRVHDLWPQRCLCFRTWRRSTAQTCTRSSSQICWTSGRMESSWVIRSLQSVAASNIRWSQTWWIIEYDLYILFHLDHRLYVVLGLNIRFTLCDR